MGRATGFGPALQSLMAGTVLRGGVATERPLSKSERRIYVDYRPLPSFTDLEREFGEDEVSTVFKDPIFQKHVSCRDIDETPGDRIFRVKRFNPKVVIPDAIAQMDKRGYRPATHLEGYAFRKANPKRRPKGSIVVAGAFGMNQGYCFNMCLDEFEALDQVPFEHDGLQEHELFLFVRK